MNSPKTNTYPKYYEVSNKFYIATAANTVSPRHPVFMTQVVLTTYDKSKYTSKVIVNCLPSQFLHFWGWFCDLQLHPPWIRFLEHSNRPIDIERLVPPKNIYKKIHGGICKLENLKMGDRKVFDDPCNALHYEPWCLEWDKGVSEPVTLPPVLDFHCSWHGEWLVIVTLYKVTLPQRVEWFIIFSQYPSTIVTHLFRATFKEMEPSHGDKEPMHHQPLYF